MHAVTFLQDLAVVMMVAGLVTVIFHRLKQPVVLGYIAAGVIIGPHTPPFPLIRDEATVHTLAELGVVLLMFALGLEFNLRKLKKVGLAAFIAAFLEILLMVWAGYGIGRLLGWKLMDSIFLGAILSISSTTIIIKALQGLNKTKERFAELIFGILIIEDMLAIAMIALLPGIATTGRLQVNEVGVTLGNLAIFLAASLVVGLLLVPRLIAYVTKFKSSEVLLVTVLGLCFGFSLLALQLGYSVALGAFLIGAVVAESREMHRIEALIEPVRDMFSAIFFVAIGLLIDPKMLAAYWAPIVGITLAVIVGKVLSCFLGAFLGGNDRRTALRVGMGLAQIGEFSFIIASLGLSLKVTSDFLYPIAVAVSAVTTLLTPYLIRNSDRLVELFDRAAPRALADSMELYTRWIGHLGAKRHPSLVSKLTTRWFVQMGINALLIAAIFIVAVFVGRRPPAWLSGTGLREEGVKTLLWVVAVICSLPLFVATSRKLQALGLLIAETNVPLSAAGARAPAIRAIIAQFIAIGGTAALGVYVLILSSTLLPTVNVLIALIILMGLLAWLLQRSFVKVYAKAQVALEETFAQAPPSPLESATQPLPTLLREANLQSITLNSDSPAARKLIRELALRTQTGASIVGIERAAANLINPGPDEELLPGDHVLLLGTPAQLAAAKEAMTARVNSV